MDENNEELDQNVPSPKDIIESHKGSNLPKSKIGGAPGGLEQALRKKAIKSGVTAAASAAKVPAPVTESVMSSSQGDEILNEAAKEPTVTQGVAHVVKVLSEKTMLYVILGSCAFFGLIFLIASVYLVKNSNNLNYAAGQFYANEDYQKVYKSVEDVVSSIQSEYGVKVDKYLIIATLTAYEGNEVFVDDTESDAYDSTIIDAEEDDGNGGTSVVSKNMSKMESYARLLAMYQIKTTTSCSADSSTPRKIASNDDSVSFFNFWKESSAREKNYDCSGGSGKSYTLSIDEGKYTDETTGGVFYWNLIDEDFLVEYYGDQLKGIGEDKTREQTKANMAEYIYLYARALAELDSCSNGTSGLQTNFSTVYTECPGVKVEPDANGQYGGTYGLEEYVAGVVADEAAFSYMNGVSKRHLGGTDEMTLENVKAFAIVIRTFTISQTNNCTTSIKNSSANQNFKPTDDAIIWKAINETEGMVLTKAGKIFLAQYDAFNGWNNCSGATCTATYAKLPSESTHTFSIPSSLYPYLPHGGHGRGMSQWESLYLSSQGKNYQEIAKFFYDDDVEIQVLKGSKGPVSSGGGTQSTGGTAFCNRTAPIAEGSGTCDETTEYKGKTTTSGSFKNGQTMTLLACTADQADKAFKEIADACGEIPQHAGSIRSLNAEVNESRSATSFHYTGRAFDFNVGEGMQSNDTYFYVTLEDQSQSESKNHYRLYCKAKSGATSDHVKNQSITPVAYINNRITAKATVTDNFLDVTAVLNSYGIYGIGPRSCHTTNYMCTEWWHFQDTSGLVKGQTTFKTTLSQYHGLSYDFASTPVAPHLSKKWNGGSYS